MSGPENPAAFPSVCLQVAPTTPASAGVLVEAAKAAEDAMREMFRYYDGGETRGSYDGKPERNGLRKAWYALRQALSTTPTPDRFGEGYRAGVEAGARALHAAEDSWNDYAWEYLPETVQQSFRDQAETVIRSLQPATGGE